jgi:hypothetical protein
MDDFIFSARNGARKAGANNAGMRATSTMIVDGARAYPPWKPPGLLRGGVMPVETGAAAQP